MPIASEPELSSAKPNYKPKETLKLRNERSASFCLLAFKKAPQTLLLAVEVAVDEGKNPSHRTRSF